MEEGELYINFNYRSPQEDFQRNMGFNSDGSLNVKYSLTCLKNLLESNIKIIDSLIEKSEKISHITSSGYDQLQIQLDNTVKEELLDRKIITTRANYDDDSDTFDYNFSDDENNKIKINMINNIISNIITPTDSEEKSDSDIDEGKNMENIINKYGNFIEEISDTEADNV